MAMYIRDSLRWIGFSARCWSTRSTAFINRLYAITKAGAINVVRWRYSFPTQVGQSATCMLHTDDLCKHYPISPHQWEVIWNRILHTLATIPIQFESYQLQLFQQVERYSPYLTNEKKIGLTDWLTVTARLKGVICANIHQFMSQLEKVMKDWKVAKKLRTYIYVLSRIQRQNTKQVIWLAQIIGHLNNNCSQPMKRPH